MDAAVRALFDPDPGYVNTATVGVPPRTAVEEQRELLESWRRGRLAPQEFDDTVQRARQAWARLTGVDVGTVAIGSAVSELVGLVAAALPDGARVVAPDNEFTSVTFPFLAHADRGVHVVEVPLEQLAEHVDGAQLVATSAVQSCDGRRVDLAAVCAAARRTGARVLLDTTQSCGWWPLDVGAVDYVVCGAYKWLLSPRGTAFLSVAPELLPTLRPLSAGWYAGADPWSSIYGGPLRLARDARRLDVSPAWFSWVGAAHAIELLAALDVQAVHDHNVGLADLVLDRLGQPRQSSAIVTLDARGGTAERLAQAGVRGSVRADRVRLSFHLYNDERDVDLVVAALST